MEMILSSVISCVWSVHYVAVIMIIQIRWANFILSIKNVLEGNLKYLWIYASPKYFNLKEN